MKEIFDLVVANPLLSLGIYFLVSVLGGIPFALLVRFMKKRNTRLFKENSPLDLNQFGSELDLESHVYYRNT